MRSKNDAARDPVMIAGADVTPIGGHAPVASWYGHSPDRSPDEVALRAQLDALGRVIACVILG